MSAIRIGESEVLSGMIDLPLTGLGVAEVEIDTDAPPAVGDVVTVELVAADGSAIGFRGAVRTSGEYHARARLLIVGGTGGLGQVVAAQHYTASPTAMQLVSDLLEATGETLSPTVDTTALEALTVPSWMRAEGVGATSLRLVAEAFGLGWRVLVDGTVWLGEQAWTEVSGALTSALYDVGADPAQERVTYADAETLLPGMTVQGRKVYRVAHSITSEGVRTEATFARAMRDDFEAAIRAAIPELPYLRSYEARVVGQNGDGSLEVIAYDAAIGGLSKVPIRYGIPGVSASVVAGARVDVAFEEANPAKAYAALWNASAGVTALRFDGAASYAGEALARVGDLTGRLIFDPGLATLYYSGGDVGATWSVVSANPQTPLPPLPSDPGTPIIIATGNEEVLA